jgi:hypothetical protein
MRAWKKMRRSWRRMSIGQKLSISATVILALSIVGVLAAEQFDRANPDDAVKAHTTGVDTETTADDAKPAGKTLELGTAAKISSHYRVAVTEISRYEVPTGQVIVATVDATYIGKQDGEPWADLSAEFSGSGSRTYDESGCPFDLGDLDPADQPTLSTGEKATYGACIELPDFDIKDGRVSIEEAFSKADRVSWSTKNAITKVAPSTAPASPGVQGPGTYSQRRQPAHHDRSDNNACDNFNSDDFEKYKEWGDSMKENYKWYRDHGGDDSDKINDYKDWQKQYDKQIDQYEEWSKDC